MDGTHHLWQLSSEPIVVDTGNNYRLTFGSQRDYLISGILETANVMYDIASAQNKGSKRELRDALEELKAAYADALISPEERQSQQEKATQEAATAKQRKLEAEAKSQQLKDEALLNFSSYGLHGSLISIRDRATRPNAPEKGLLEPWQQIEPIPSTMNSNFLPHKELGDALFKNNDAQVLKTLAHICTKNPLPFVGDDARAADCGKLLDVLAKPIEEIAPTVKTAGIRDRLIEANREGNERLITQLLDSPYLMIAAAGTPENIKDAKALQSMLMPEKAAEIPDEQTAFTRIGCDVPPALAARLGAMKEISEEPTAPQPPAPPATPPRRPGMASLMSDTDDANWERIVSRADAFVSEHLKDTPPYNLFRCQLDMQPGHAVTLHLSRWLDSAHHTNVETISDTVLLNTPSTDRALEIKKRLQSHIFNKHEVMEHRRLHAGFYMGDDDSFLPDVPPVPDPNQPHPDGRAGRIIKRSGIYALRLTFDHPDPQTQAPAHTETEIPLGVRQSADPAEAERRRDLVLAHIQVTYDTGRRITPQDLRIRLKGAVTNYGRNEEQWQLAETIDLNQHPEINRKIDVNFPSPQHGEATSFYVENPKLEGTPNAFWTIPISIRLDGKEFVSTSINTHVQDAQVATARINEITEHLKNSLETYAKEHPAAKWYRPEGTKLKQLDPGQGEACPDIDWTRLNHMKNELGYVRQLAVRVSEINVTPCGPRFNLTVQRADGSDFLEEQGRTQKAVPIRRTFTLPEGNEAATQEKVEQFRAAVNAKFSGLVDEAYSPTRDAAFEPEAGATALKAVQQYNSRSIVNMFDGACADALQANEADITQVGGEVGEGGHGSATARVKRSLRTNAK